MKELILLLEELNACDEAIEWLSEFAGSPEEAWLQCERGDWMLWLLDELQADRKKLVWTACQCARPALQFIPSNESRPKQAIKVAEAWTKGEATLEEVQVAVEAVEAAEAGWGAWAAAKAAAWAAWAAREAAWVARMAARMAAEAAWAASLKLSADIVRQNFNYEEVLELIKEYHETASD